MMSFLKTFFGGGRAPTDVTDEAAVSAAIESVIDATDPRLRMVGSYKKKLREPVQHALEYIGELVEKVPGPLEINRRAFGLDTQAHALFGSADQLQEVFSLSANLREFLDQPKNRDLSEVHLVLVMDKEEKTILGMELDGDMLKKDVKQTVVNFTAHRVVTPAATEGSVREALIQRGVNHLAQCALETIVTLRHRRQELEKRRSLLRTKLGALRAGRIGMEPLLEADRAELTDMTAIQQELEETEEKLQEAVTDIKTLDDYLLEVQSVLRHPEEYLRLGIGTVRVNRMGVRVTASEPGTDVVFAEIEIGQAPKRVGLLVKYPRDEILPREHFLARARP